MGAEAGGTVIANKPFRMFGINYEAGDVVDVSHLPDHKVGQLMNQRYIRPMPPMPPADPAEPTGPADPQPG